MSFQDKLLDSFIAFEQVVDLDNPIHTDRKNALKRFERISYKKRRTMEVYISKINHTKRL